MADIHQTTATPPAAPTPDPSVVLPRSQEAQTPPDTGDAAEKAARETKERMSKTTAFWNRLSPDKEESDKPKDKGETPAKKEAKAEPAAAAAKKEPESKEPKEKKAKRRIAEPEIDPLEIARATGQEIGREMAKATQAVKAPHAPAEETFEIPDEFKPDIAVFEEMARLDPKRYGNLKKEIAQYTKAETEYIAQWEKEHQGETFDGDSGEHDDFYARIRPDYEQKDFKAAEKSLLKNEVRKEVSEELRSREAESDRRRERAAQIQPEVDRDMVGTLGDIIREVDPDNAELAKDWASIQTLDEKNPLLADVMVAVHNETKPVVTAAVRLFRAVDAPDPNNPTHARVFDVITKGEQAVSRLPIKDRYDDDGRLFATQEDYAKMSPTDKARHWYIGEREVVALIRGQAISQTKSIYERKKQEIERYTKGNNVTQASQRQQEKKADSTPNTRSDNGSPSVTGRGTLPGDGKSGSSKPATGRDLMFSRLLGA